MVNSFVVEDVCAAVRALWRRPAASHWPLLALAVAIATSTAITTVASLVLLRPLPFPDAKSLVYITSLAQDASPIRPRPSGVSWASWEALRELPAFQDVGAWTRESVSLSQPGRAIVERWRVSASVLPMLGVQPVIGRLFTADEYGQARHGPAVISWDFWQTSFGGRADILGQTVGLIYTYTNHDIRTVVGVLPRGVALKGRRPDVILPLAPSASPEGSRSNGPVLALVARLAAPDALEAARSGASEFVPSLTTANRPLKGQVVTVADDVYGEGAGTELLGLAALMVLIIACGSTAAIATSDIVERRGEMAVRLAIGAAPHWVLIESVARQAALTLVALAIAAPVAFWLVGYAVATLLPSLTMVGLSLGALTIFPLSLLITTSAIMIAAAVPSLIAARWLGAAPPASSLPRATSRLAGSHRVLLGAQLAACLTLVVCASLLEQTVWRLTSQPLGFDPKDLVVVSFTATTVPSVGAGDRFKTAVHIDALVESVRRLPGVTAAAAVRDAPFASHIRTVPFLLPGDTVPSHVQVNGVSHAYFETMRLRLVAGRTFEPSDSAWSPRSGTGNPVNVIVSESLARQFNGPALGAKLVLFGSQPHLVVGIVEDVRQENYRDDNLPAVYIPPNTFDSFESLVLRFSPGVTVSAAAIRQAFEEFDPTIVVTAVHPLPSLLERSLAAELLRARSAALFGSAAVFLAVAGIYATGRRAADQRRKECAVRLALGAGTADIARVLGRDALVAAVIGLVIGLPLALTGGYGLRHVLFGVSATQPLALAIGVGCLFGAVIIAMAQPIWRMARIEPSKVLRDQ